MTPAAIRAAEGPALDAFVAEHVLGWLRVQSNGRWIPGGDAHPLMNTVEAPDSYSTDNAACWRWVVPALVAKGYYFDVIHNPDVSSSERWGSGVLLSAGGRYVCGFAPTPALAIVRAAALTVAEGGE